MNSRLQTLYDQLESQRADLLNEVRTLTAEKFNQRPDGKWSTNQILAHVIAAERMSLQYLQKKVLALNEVSDTGFYEELKMVLLKVSQRLPGLKFRAPKIVLERTPSYGTFAELEADWEKLRIDLKAFLENLGDDHIKKRIYRHAVAGRLNVQHALLFFREHIVHHHPQIKSRSK